MTKVFLDASILMEIMMSRSKIGQVSVALHDPDAEFYISSLTVHILYYFAESEKIDRELVSRLAGLAAHLPVAANTVRKAQERYAATDSNDFEDCLQAACAEIAACGRIITLDKHFEHRSGTILLVHLLR